MSNERGLSLSTLTACLLPAFVIVAGLGIDGAAQVAANRRAEAIASSAARAGMDASAASRIQGDMGSYFAVSAAKDYVSKYSNLNADVSVAESGELNVVTKGRTQTIFLSIIGVDQLACRGEASVDLFSS